MKTITLIEGMPVLCALYLSYFNDFISVARFAEFHNMSEQLAVQVIQEGKELYNDLYN